jgi:deoxyribodipyrimidine photolyase-related protein
MINQQAVSLVYPHQLFRQHPALSDGRPVMLIEDELFFTQYRFHLQKIAFHRISMRKYEEALKSRGFETTYFNCHSPEANTEKLFITLKQSGIKEIHAASPDDYLLQRRLQRFADRSGIRVIYYQNPNFICSEEELKDYFGSGKKFFLTEFYIHQRKLRKVLLEDGQPLGGKWTYDTENRKKMPASVKVPDLPVVVADDFTNDILNEVRQQFPDNPGSIDEFIYPTDHAAAEKWLDVFFKKRFNLYGDYQDAIVKDQTFLFHSILTPMLNSGLLDPGFIIERALDTSVNEAVPLNALEGFIRQVLGWREFIRAVYLLEGVGQRKRNYFNHQRKIPASFYQGNTGIAPIDDAIKKTLRFGYTHHIERLMILGNFMLLCEFDPDEVYRWFMELFIDAYDWVMVPNVYGMSQYADGGWMSTKPYISGSNYVLKMSNHTKGDWCELWDALYWRFIYKHREIFIKNPRMSMMVRQAEKMEPEKFRRLMKRAEDYLNTMA